MWLLYFIYLWKSTLPFSAFLYFQKHYRSISIKINFIYIDLFRLIDYNNELPRRFEILVQS